MLGIYLAAALFGGIIIGVSFLVGGHDGADHGGPDHGGLGHGALGNGADHGHPGADDPHGVEKFGSGGAAQASDIQWLWLPLMSLRFWTFFCASFGLTGVLLTLFGIGEPITGLVSLPFGGLIGYGAAMVFLKLNTSQVSGDVGLERFVGTEAKVMLPIRPGDIGKITVQTMAGTFEMPARTRDAALIEPGRMVMIAGIADGVADVTDVPDITALTASARSAHTE